MALLAVVGCSQPGTDRRADSLGDSTTTRGTAGTPTALDLEIPTLGGGTISLRSFRGKVVLLNIWASWCGPCRDEFPLLAQLTRELAGDDFAVIAASDDLDAGSARRFLAEQDPPFAIAWARGSLQQDLGYRGLPFTALIDREGRIVERYIGFGGARQFTALRADVLRAIRDSVP